MEDVKVTTPDVHKADSGEHLETETPNQVDLRGEPEVSAPPRRGRPRKPGPQVISGPLGAGREPDRQEILKRYGPSKGQQILDAAAGRKPPYTRPVSPGKREEGIVDTGPINARELHLLPRPISFDLTPDQFFKYWALLSGEELDRVKIYPYRMWPVVDVNLPLTEEELDLIRRHEKKPPPRNLGVLKEPIDWKNWQADVCHRFGAGDYNFKLNDTHPAVRRTICQTAIVGVLRDMDTYPPDVNVQTVVVDDPANVSYVRWCRLKGIRLPGDQPSREETSSMADVRTVEILGKQNEKLLEHALDNNKKGNSGDAVTEAIKSVTSLMTGASEKSQQMLVDSINKRAQSEDPMAFHQRVMSTAKELYGSPEGKDGGTSAVLKSMEMMMTQQKEANASLVTLLLSNQKSLEERLIRAEERAQKAQDKVMDLQIRGPQPPVQVDANGQPVAPRTMGQQMGELTTMINGLMKLVETVTARAAAGGAEDRMGPLGRALMVMAENAPNMLYNLAVVRSAGQPNAPQPQPPPSEEVEEAPPPTGEVTEEQAAQNLLTSLEQPLVRALAEGVNGAEFGARLMMTHGPAVYELIASQTDDALVTFLQNNRAIFGAMQKMPQRAMAFLQEFRDAERARGFYERLRSSTITRQTPPPPPAPKPANAGGRPSTKPGTRTVYTPKGPVEVEAEGGRVVDATPEPSPPAA